MKAHSFPNVARVVSRVEKVVRRHTWTGLIEEFPINMWDVVVTDWKIGSVVLVRRVFYKKCHGYDSAVAAPHNAWLFVHGITEYRTCPSGCLFIMDEEVANIAQFGRAAHP